MSPATAESPAHRRLLTPVAVFSALSMLRQGLPLLLLPVYVAYIDAAEYGVLASLTIAAAFVAMVANLKLDSAVRTFFFDYADEEARLRAYTGQIVTVAVLCSGATWAIAFVCGTAAFEVLFGDAEIRFLPEGAIAIATACISAGIAPYLAFLRARHALRELIARDVVLVIGTIGCQLTLVAGFGLGLRGILWGALLPVAAVAVMIVVANPWLVRPGIDWRMLRPSFRYALPLVGLGLVYAIGGRLDGLVLVRYVSLDQFGAYAIAIGIFGLLRIALSVLDDAFRPFLFPALRSGDPSASRVVAACHRFYLLIGLVALSAAAGMSSAFHLLTDDPRYLAMQDWIPWVASAFAPRVVIRFHSLVLEAHKRSLGMTAGVVVRLLVLALMLIWFVPVHGVIGALWAATIAETVNAIMFVLATRHTGSLHATAGRAALQIAVFLIVIWCVSATLAAWSITLSGVVQCAAVTVTLLWLNGFHDPNALRTTIAELVAGEQVQAR